MHIKPPLSEAHQLQEIAIKTGGAAHSGSTCHVVMEVCDGYGWCCQTSSDGLDNPGLVDRETGETDIYTNTTILGNCAEAVITYFHVWFQCPMVFISLFCFQGRLLDDPVTATLTTNDDNEDGELLFLCNKMKALSLGWAVEWAQITKSTGKMFYCTFNAWFKVKDGENRSSVTVNCTSSGK